MQNTARTQNSSRRAFIKQSSLAAALSVFHPFHIRAEEAKKKLRIGVIGCGLRAGNVIDGALKDGRYEITALADYFQDQVDKCGEKYNVPANRRFTGLDCHKRMIHAGGIDIIAVLSPPYFHPEQAAAAVDAGLHVWLAKPMAIDVPGLASIEASAKKATENKRCFLVDFQTRSFAHYHEAARLVAAGDLGNLGYGEIMGNCTAFPLKVPQDNPAAKLRNWIQWKGLCGESIVEYSIHAIDMARLLVGRAPVRATGRCERRFLDHMPVPTPGDVKDIWLADYDFGDDLKMSFRGLRFSGHGLPGFVSLHVNLYGMRGGLAADYSGEVIIKGEKPFSGDQFMNEKIRGIYDKGILNNFATFYNNIETGNYAQETVAPSVQSHYMAFLGREAGYRCGESITMDEIMKSTTRSVLDPSGLTV